MCLRDFQNLKIYDILCAPALVPRIKFYFSSSFHVTHKTGTYVRTEDHKRR